MNLQLHHTCLGTLIGRHLVPVIIPTAQQNALDRDLAGRPSRGRCLPARMADNAQHKQEKCRGSHGVLPMLRILPGRCVCTNRFESQSLRAGRVVARDTALEPSGVVIGPMGPTLAMSGAISTFTSGSSQPLDHSWAGRTESS